MQHAANRSRFPFEAIAKMRLLRASRQDLERDDTLKPCVHRLVHVPPTAHANQSHDSVWADLIARPQERPMPFGSIPDASLIAKSSDGCQQDALSAIPIWFFRYHIYQRGDSGRLASRDPVLDVAGRERWRIATPPDV